MIGAHLRQIASRNPDHLAIVDGDERITYGQLIERINGIAGWLQNSLGLRPGDVVAASLTNSWQFAACFFAISELGGIFMPCNPQWRAPELRGLAGRLGLRGVVTEPQFRQEWDRVGEALAPASVFTLDDAASSWETDSLPGPVPAYESLEEAPALYLVTSGSTGAPKIVPRTHRNLVAGSANSARAAAAGPGRRFLGVAPFYHANGFHNCMLLSLMSGASLVVMRHFIPAACAELVHRERTDILIGSPLIFRLLADRVTDPGLFATLKICISAGARLPRDEAERWKTRFGIRLRQLYGSSEANVISIDSSDREPPAGAGFFVGTPIPGVEIRCLGPGGESLDHGVAGELAVRSPAVMSGYVGDPERNQQVFHDGFFRTGDLGYLDSNGNLYLTGRVGRIMNVSGTKIDPVEIELALESLAGVFACRVDGVPDGRDGEVIRARIAVRDGITLTRRDVIERCRERLAEYKLPRIIEFVEDLPLTISGKTAKP